MYASDTFSVPLRCTHATPTWRPPGPWPLFAEPYYCGTDVAKNGSAEGALAGGPLGSPALASGSFAGVRRGWLRWLRVAARACHPKGGIVPLVLTVFTVKCAVTLRPSMGVAYALLGVADLAWAPSPPQSLPKAVALTSHFAASPPHRHPKGGLYSIPHLCVGISVYASDSTLVSCCTHATPTWRPPGPWPLLAEPRYCGTDVAEKGSAEGALAAGPPGGPALASGSFAAVPRGWPRLLLLAAHAYHPKGGFVPWCLVWIVR